MADQHPHSSNTLPRGFHFHYTDGETPQTPKRKIQRPVPKAHAPAVVGGGFRIRRRTRSRAMPSDLFDRSEIMDAADAPIPTIEEPVFYDEDTTVEENTVQEFSQRHLSPDVSRTWPLPRTPSGQTSSFDGGETWSRRKHHMLGINIVRPSSAGSVDSISSEESDVSSMFGTTYGGSCTSPDSDTGDPFIHRSDFKTKDVARSLFKDAGAVSDTPVVLKSKDRWTSDMDQHLWTIYQLYLQDPTVTPIKTLPGAPPPLGVCHRVAREAKRSWQEGKSRTKKPARPAPDSMHLSPTFGPADAFNDMRSGSPTPTASRFQPRTVWPKLGATRRRLRELAKSRAIIEPYYWKLLQGRSPSPFTSSQPPSRQATRSRSPENTETEPSFSTRNVQIALSMSTSSTMQPNGPLAQLSNPSARPAGADDWFNNPTGPWASPPTNLANAVGLPSVGVDGDVDKIMSDAPRLSPPRLGKAFEYHTWGPSRSRPHLRPTAGRANSETTSAAIPPLASLAPIHRTFPYTNNHNKRRAARPLDDDVSPGGSDLRRKPVPDDIFAPEPENTNEPEPTRRVRPRGHTFQVGDVNFLNRLASVYTPPRNSASQSQSNATPAPPAFGRSLNSHFQESTRPLGSPFAGISRRPDRARGRHFVSSSLSAFNPNVHNSFDSSANNPFNQRPSQQ